MIEDWTDKETARSFDENPTRRNPVRIEQLDILLALIENEYRSGQAILDVGMGSGVVEEMIFERIPGAYVIGLDFSDAMLERARARLSAYSDSYEVVMQDLTLPGPWKLPEKEYSVVVSVQTIHNVEDKHKEEAFRNIYNTLASGGLFLLLDRIKLDTPGLFSAYEALWARQEREYGWRPTEGPTFEEHTAFVSGRGDIPASLEWHLSRLREAGFEVACLHLHANRALIAGRKP